MNPITRSNRGARSFVTLIALTWSVVALMEGCSSQQQQSTQGEPVAQQGQRQSKNAVNSANANNVRNNTANYAVKINNAVEPEEEPVANVPPNAVNNVVAENDPTNTTALAPNTVLNAPPTQMAANLAPLPPSNTPAVVAPPQNTVLPPQQKQVTKVIDLGPPHGVLQWVGYNYRKEARKLDVQIVTDGRPIYKIFQDANRAKQPEIVVRFLNTDIRHKIRRDIDASEFRSPVAFIRMRRDNIFRHSDVILTLRDSVQPKMIAKGSSIMLTFDIPDRWYGPEGDESTPIAKVEITPDANVMPVNDAASDAVPTSPQTTITTYVDDPGKDEFKSIPADAAVPLVPTDTTTKEHLATELVPATATVPTPVSAAANVATPFNNAALINSPNPKAINKTVAAPPVAVPKQVKHAALNLAPEAQPPAPVRQPQRAPQQQVLVPPAPVMMAPPPMMAPQQQIVPIPQGVPGVVPQMQYNPGTPTATPQPAVPPAPKDGGQGADKFEVRSDFNEYRFTIAGVAQASGNYAADIPAPVTNSTAVGYDVNTESVEYQGVEQTAAPTEIQGVEQTAAVAASAPIPPKKLMKFDFRSATIGTVLRAISNESGLNFVMPPEIASKKMTVSLNNISWDVALKAVLEANRLGMEELGPKIIRIDSLKTFVEDHDSQDRAKQASAALVPTKVLVMRLSYALAEKIMPIVQDMFPKPAEGGNIAQQRNYSRFKVKSDVRSNSIIVEATPTELAKIKALVERLDLATPQVRISSRIVEVLASAEAGLGISWGSPFNIDGGRGLGFGSLPFPNNLTSNFAVDPAMGGTPVGAVSARFGSINNVMALDLKIKMLETRSEAESLQSQDLVVEDNQEAKIEAGSVDYFTAPATGLNGPTLTPVTYSTSLNVIPHVTADGAVQMNLKITGDVPQQATSPNAAAGKTTRGLNTTMIRRSGDTAVIGGLYTTDKSKVVTGVPYLSRLPIIGALFRSTYSKDQRRDLLIMVTPTIINTAAGNNEQEAIGGGIGGPLSAGAQGINAAPSGNLAVDAEAMNPPANAQQQSVQSNNAAGQQQAPSQNSENSGNVSPASNESNFE